MKKIFYLCAACLVILSCKPEQAPPVPTQYSGLITSETFTICDPQQKSYPMVDSTGAVTKNIARLEPRSKRALSATVMGYKTSENASDSVFVITQIIDIEAKNYRNTCIPYDFWILCNEPTVSVQISEAEDIIEIVIPDSDTFIQNKWIAPSTNGDTLIYTLKGERHSRIIITKQPCSDGMTDRVYSYAAQIEIGGNTYTGCALDYSQRNLSGE